MRDNPDMIEEEPTARLRSGETGQSPAQQAPEPDSVLMQIQTRTALRDSEERLRAILESAVDGIMTIDEEGRIESMNPSGARMFGYNPDELAGRNVKLLIPAIGRKDYDSLFQRHPETVDGKMPAIDREVMGRRKDGAAFPLELSVAEARLAVGKRFVGFLRDTTSRKSSEQQMLAALKELNEVRAALDEHSIVAITDASGKITYVNDKFCAISKYSREELLGQDHRIINSRHHPKEFFRDLWNTIAHGKVWHGEIRNRARDGSFYWVDTTICPFLNEAGRPVQYVAIRTDITQRKADEAELRLFAQTLAEKNRELEAIVYAASHDLRSPLVNIQGFSNELARICDHMKSAVAESNDGSIPAAVVQEAFGTDIPRALRFIKAGVARIDSLLNGFLRYSRLGRVVLNIQPLDMNALISSVAQALKYQFDQAGATLTVERLPGCLGDPTHVGQVFSNLLDNALKYRDPSRPLRINVRGRVEEHKAVYTVADNGIGIAPEHQDKVFEIFHRLDPKSGTGEGLGLTIAQRIMERHRGRIWVESSAGAGSEFHVALAADEEETAGKP